MNGGATIPFDELQRISTMCRERSVRLHCDGARLWEVRCSLVDIINPPSVSDDEQIKYKRESDGGTSELLMEQLIAAGIYMDLFRARATATKTQAVAAKKK